MTIKDARDKKHPFAWAGAWSGLAGQSPKLCGVCGCGELHELHASENAPDHGVAGKLSEEQRQALLRLAEFESRRVEAAPDATILMMQLALYKLFERDPKRVARIIGGALAIYSGGDDGRAPWWDKPS
jgi:hypothetical protein